MFSIPQTRWIIGKENRLPGGPVAGDPWLSGNPCFRLTWPRSIAWRRRFEGQRFPWKTWPCLPAGYAPFVQFFLFFFFKVSEMLLDYVSMIFYLFYLFVLLFVFYFWNLFLCALTDRDLCETCSRLCAPGSSCWPTDASMEPLIMWYLAGDSSHTVDGSQNPANHHPDDDYPIIYRVEQPSQVVVWDFSHQQ